MTDGTWILLTLAAAVATGGLGYLIGRRNSARQAEIDRLEEELQAARERAESIKAGLDSHFEQSAVLFGTLAKDYRAFLDHFSESAGNLGVSQGRTAELLEQVRQPLLARSATAEPAPETGPEPATKPKPPGTSDGTATAGSAASSAKPPVAAADPEMRRTPDSDGTASETPDAPASADEASDARPPRTAAAADKKNDGT